MKDHASYAYERVIVTGRLVTRGDMHVGSGFEETVSRGDGRDEMHYPSLCLDAAGEPYIPASTLRGLLCGLLEQLPAEHWRLCGTARQALDKSVPQEQRSVGSAGAIRLYDARWAQGQRFAQCLEQRVALDPVTRTAGDHLLFTDALLPRGARFDCRFELDRIDRDDLCAFLTALRSLGDTPGIGAGRSRRQGGLEWAGEQERVQVLSRSRFREWLRLEGVEPLESYFDPEVSSLETYGTPSGWRGVSPAAAIVETLIRPTSPLLVSPERGGARGEKLDLIFRREGEQVRIPASSLKGMLRAQCRRILLTKLESRFPDTEDKLRVRVADDMIGNIFGSTDAAALLYLDDARGPYAEKDVHRQFFNAVDRFTGGAAKHRLYNVRAVFPKELAWKLNLQPPLLEPDAAWALALLCYVLRDAMEGDLSIGWGRARGYGSFRLALDLAAGKVLSDWSEVLRELDEGGLDFASGTAEGWLDALEKELAERMQVAAQAAEGGGQQ